jgi:hypothetical protein
MAEVVQRIHYILRPAIPFPFSRLKSSASSFGCCALVKHSQNRTPSLIEMVTDEKPTHHQSKKENEKETFFFGYFSIEKKKKTRSFFVLKVSWNIW